MKHLTLLALMVLGGCAASTASYTRFRHQVEQGHAVAAEEVRPSELINYHARLDAPRPPSTVVAEQQGLGLSAELGNPDLPLGPSRPVLQVSLRGAAGVVRAPAHIILVVDLSGSMNEQDKIGAVRHAVARFVEALDPADRISLVTFSNHATGIGPRTVGEQRYRILAAIAGWQADGGTNLHAALEQADALATADLSPGGIDRIVLLSDGMPTVGITDGNAILSLAASLTARGLSITTVGMGDQIDDALLSGIARVGGGQYHFLDRPSEVERVFAEELRSLTESAARDVVVHTRLPTGWSLARAFHEETSMTVGGFVSRVGDVGGDEAVVLLFELDAPHAAGTSEQVIVTAELAVPSCPQVRRVVSAPIQVTRGGAVPYDPAPGGVVLRNLVLGRAAVALRDADLLRRRGDGLASVSVLRSGLDELDTARARLVARGEHELAASLDEPASLVRRAFDDLRARALDQAAPRSSAAWSDWGPDASGVPGSVTVPCEIPGGCASLPWSR
jgi:Mg-chelatase subunit ChlD